MKKTVKKYTNFVWEEMNTGAFKNDLETHVIRPVGIHACGPAALAVKFAMECRCCEHTQCFVEDIDLSKYRLEDRDILVKLFGYLARDRTDLTKRGIIWCAVEGFFDRAIKDCVLAHFRHSSRCSEPCRSPSGPGSE